MKTRDEGKPRSVNGPMVQVGWFCRGMWISLGDYASLRGTTIRNGAVPVYADAADARGFPGVAHIPAPTTKEPGRG